MPGQAAPPFCIFLLTIMMWVPFPVGNNDVRKGKPLISPLTLNWPRLPQILATSSATRMITQLSPSPERSSVARNDLVLPDAAIAGVTCRIVKPRRGSTGAEPIDPDRAAD